MKTLVISRHAKSDWNNPGLADFDRPLNQRGHVNAPDMATRLIAKGFRPDAIVSSPALRAATTATYFAEATGLGGDAIILDQRIYEASLKTLLAVVNGFDDAFETVMLVGHNPGLSNLSEELSGRALGNLPTCGIVCLDFDLASWNLVSGGTGALRLFDYPKNTA